MAGQTYEYRIKTPDGEFSVQSDRELTDAEAYQYATASQPKPPAPAAKPSWTNPAGLLKEALPATANPFEWLSNPAVQAGFKQGVRESPVGRFLTGAVKVPVQAGLSVAGLPGGILEAAKATPETFKEMAIHPRETQARLGSSLADLAKAQVPQGQGESTAEKLGSLTSQLGMLFALSGGKLPRRPLELGRSLKAEPRIGGIPEAAVPISPVSGPRLVPGTTVSLNDELTRILKDLRAPGRPESVGQAPVAEPVGATNVGGGMAAETRARMALQGRGEPSPTPSTQYPIGTSTRFKAKPKSGTVQPTLGISGETPISAAQAEVSRLAKRQTTKVQAEALSPIKEAVGAKTFPEINQAFTNADHIAQAAMDAGDATGAAQAISKALEQYFKNAGQRPVSRVKGNLFKQQRGAIPAGPAFALGGAVAGGAIGGTQGNDASEHAINALLGAIAGGALFPSLGKALTKAGANDFIVALRANTALWHWAVPKNIAQSLGTPLIQALEQGSIKPLKEQLRLPTNAKEFAKGFWNKELPGVNPDYQTPRLPGIDLAARGIAGLDRQLAASLGRTGKYTANQIDEILLRNKSPFVTALTDWRNKGPLTKQAVLFTRVPSNFMLTGGNRLNEMATGRQAGSLPVTRASRLLTAGSVGAGGLMGSKFADNPSYDNFIKMQLLAAALSGRGLPFLMGAATTGTLKGGFNVGAKLTQGTSPISDYWLNPATAIPKSLLDRWQGK